MPPDSHTPHPSRQLRRPGAVHEGFHGNTAHPSGPPFGDPVTTRARRLPPRRPRRRDRLLVLGLAMALVATLDTRALAGDTDSLSSLESPGEQTDQANQLSANQAPGQRTAAQGDHSSDDVTSVTPPEFDEPPSVIAQAEHNGGQVQGAGQQLTGQPEQDEQPSSPTGGCLDSPCSQEPPGPGDPTVKAAAEGGGFLDPTTPAASAVPPQQLPPPQPWQQPPSIEDLDQTLTDVEKTQAERTERNRRLGYWETQSEYSRLQKVYLGLQQLLAQTDEGTLDRRNELAELQRRYDQAHDQYWADRRRAFGEIGWSYLARENLELVEDEVGKAQRTTSEGRPSDYESGERSWHADQARLNNVRRSLQQVRPSVEARRDPSALDELAYLEDWLGRAQRRLDEFHPMVGVEFDTKIPGYSQVKDKQVHKLPGTSIADLRTNVPAIKATTDLKTTVPSSRATDVPPASALHRMNLTEQAAFALGVDPATVANAGTVGSVVLVGGAGLLWLLSYAYPQLRLALAQGTLKGGLNAVPLLPAPRPVDG